MNSTKLTLRKLSRRKFLEKSAIAFAGISIVPRFVLGGNGYIAPSDKINLGFIGTGKQSAGLSKRFMKLEEVKMLAASDVDQKKLTRFKEMTEKFYAEAKGTEKYNGCLTYANYKDLLENTDIDAVIIATPDHWHAKMTVDAAKAGKDIYTEKPISHSIKDGQKMVKAVEKYRIVK